MFGKHNREAKVSFKAVDASDSDDDEDDASSRGPTNLRNGYTTNSESEGTS